MSPKLTGKQYGFLRQLVHFVYTTHHLPEIFTIEPAPYNHVYIGPTKYHKRDYFFQPEAIESLPVLLDFGYIQLVDEDGIQKYRITESGKIAGRWDL